MGWDGTCQHLAKKQKDQKTKLDFKETISLILFLKIRKSFAFEIFSGTDFSLNLMFIRFQSIFFFL